MEFVRNKEVFSAAWLSEKLGKNVKSSQIIEGDKLGGLSGEMVFIQVEYSDGEKEKLLLKKSPDGVSPMRVAAGTAREALFYSNFSQKLGTMVSKTHWTYADMKAGESAILMECLNDCVPSGVFFGKGNPNNWGLSAEKYDELIKDNPDALTVTKQAFAIYANMHATYWCPVDILKDDGFSWLNGHDRLSGQGMDRFKETQAVSHDGWIKMLPAITAGNHYVQWDEHLVACLKTSFAKVDWVAYQTELKTRPFSLVHGDAHPHNFLWCDQRTDMAHLKLIDFEMIGLGSPAQELGQYLISHMEPSLRRSNERNLVQEYHTQVCSHLEKKKKRIETETETEEVGDRNNRNSNEKEFNTQYMNHNNFDLAMCWQEYVDGGFGRWAWFVGGFDVFFGGEKNAKMCQFFHDQLAAFARDHIPDPRSAPMPRI